jgi:predicted ABC-type transport system involved in lysophospholipase L1 biosynthesis ATPase subunit
MSDAAVIASTDLSKSYRSGTERLVVLDGIHLSVTAGDSVSIRGESGAGKTTLLNLLAGIDTPDRGTVLWDGVPLESLDPRTLASRRARTLGMVFQGIHLVPELTAAENVLLAARIAGGVDATARARATELLRRVDLGARAHHLPAHLSGGERQRVAVARALMNRPRFLLADEPTGNLDEATGERVIDLLLELCAQEGAALVLVTHNLQHAARTRRQAVLTRHALRDAQPATP